MARKPASNRKPHHNVYVIEFASEIQEDRRFRKVYPDIDPEAVCVYVGLTGLTPELRFDRHKRGKQSSRLVRKFGLRLRPDLYERLNPMWYQEAADAERRLAEELRGEGFVVWSH